MTASRDGVQADSVAEVTEMTSLEEKETETESEPAMYEAVESEERVLESTGHPTVTGPTGYPEGELQFISVFHDGNLYVQDTRRTITKDEFSNMDVTALGTVVRIDNSVVPGEELVASQLPVETVIWKDDEKPYLYAYIEGDDPYVIRLCEEED